MLKRQELLFRQMLIGCDLAVLVLSFVAAYWLRGVVPRAYGTLFPLDHYLWLLWIIVPTWIFLRHRCGLHSSAAYMSFGRIMSPLFKTHFLGGLMLFAILYLTKSEEVSRSLMQAFIGISLIGLSLETLGIQAALVHLMNKPRAKPRKVLVIGTNARAAQYVQLLHERVHWGAEVVGFLTTDGKARPTFCGHPVFGRLQDLSEVLKTQVVDEVVVVFPWRDGLDLTSLAVICVERGLTLRTLVTVPLFSSGKHHVEDLGTGLYLLSLEMIPNELLPLVVKRVIDIVSAVIGLLCCSVVYLWYKPKLQRESPGPVFFRQDRVGQNGRLFTLYKFRTMHLDAEARLQELRSRNDMIGDYIFKMRDDPRITPTGRTLRSRHLDELPQFWNVLRGDMSLVGTRPPTPDEVKRYRPHHRRRISMKCGLTGPWQVQGNGSVNNFEDIVKLDCEYINNWSLKRDLAILAKTLVKVFRGDGW
jgi:exopolysaccharide biosynthesis polyprenyl glycosylphosphotransferase